MLFALYKPKFDGRPLDTLIDVFSGGGGYSHAEIVFDLTSGPPGEIPLSFSSTSRDPSTDTLGRVKPDGTRFKRIDYREHPERWDLWRLPHGVVEEWSSRLRCQDLLDARYDYYGCGRVPLKAVRLDWLLPRRPHRFFCSEVSMEAAQWSMPNFWPDVEPQWCTPNLMGKLAEKRGLKRFQWRD